MATDTPPESERRTDDQIISCRECNTEFNLTAQWYYAPLCPSCYADEAGVTETWPTCVMCDARMQPDNTGTATLHTHGHRERVRVCSEGCRDHAQCKPWAPTRPDRAKGDEPFGIRVEETPDGLVVDAAEDVELPADDLLYGGNGDDAAPDTA